MKPIHNSTDILKERSTNNNNNNNNNDQDNVKIMLSFRNMQQLLEVPRDHSFFSNLVSYPSLATIGMEHCQCTIGRKRQ